MRGGRNDYGEGAGVVGQSEKINVIRAPKRGGCVFRHIHLNDKMIGI
jgi:hypothetical protein